MISVVPTATAVAMPSEMVATPVWLEVHVAIDVTSTGPLHVVAIASNVCVAWSMVMLALDGVTAIDSMHPTLTVSDAVPDIVPFWTDVAVIVVWPMLTEVANPEALIVAKPGSELLHVTEGLPVLPSL